MTSFPSDLSSLFYNARTMGDLSQQTGETVFWSCLQHYVSQFAQQYSKTVASMTHEHKQFFLSSLLHIRAKFLNPRRVKRQVRITVRREIRMLSPPERADLFRAINSLKMDTRLPPNIHDFMANYHSGDNIRAAHRGPAFPAWHRLFILLYEYFLQLHVPSVALPYWASVLDQQLPDPTQSVIWSAAFMGNGVGRPRRGPFANWTSINSTSVFERNIGFGPLYTWQDIREILRRTRNEDILLPTADLDADFEGIHGGPHMFVGRSMASLHTAARDPIFYMHHAFVDMIWQAFRFRQIRNRINPETDYPYNVSDFRFRREHAPNAPMGFQRTDQQFQVLLPVYQQRLGYSLYFDRYIRYAPIPSCSFRRRNCGSPYLFCRLSGGARCASRTIASMPQVNFIDEIMPRQAAGSSSARVKRQVRQPLYELPPSQTCPLPQFVNDLLLRENSNGEETLSGDWVKVPARVITKRPPEYDEFSDYSLYGYTSRGRQSLGQKESFLIPGEQRSYRGCDKHLNTVGRVKLMSYGINYDGSAEEYALSDNRLGISETTGFVAVKRPKPGVPTEAFISAFDSCGRVCKPYCLRRGQGGFSMGLMAGGIRVTTDTPLQFGETFAEATLASWKMSSAKGCPTVDPNNIPITFYCDYGKDWFWFEEEGQGFMAATRLQSPALSSSGSNPSPTGGPSLCRLSALCTLRGPCRPCENARTYRCMDRRYRATCRPGSTVFIVYEA